MNTANLARAALAAALAAGLAACDGDGNAEPTPRTSVGERVDSALDRTQQKLSVAGEQTQQTLAEASDRLQPKLERAGERIAEAGSQVAANVRDAIDSDKQPEAGAVGEPRRSRGGVTTSVRTGERTSFEADGVPALRREALSDAAITAAVKTDLLRDPTVRGLKIDVDTEGGVVTLQGEATAGERTRAEQLARSVKGVKDVQNRLQAKGA